MPKPLDIGASRASPSSGQPSKGRGKPRPYDPRSVGLGPGAAGGDEPVGATLASPWLGMPGRVGVGARRASPPSGHPSNGRAKPRPYDPRSVGLGPGAAGSA